jgi:hypothetical protein
LKAARSDKGTRRSQYVTLDCEVCPNTFERRLSQLKKRAFCSRECFQQSTAPSDGGKAGGGRPRQLPFTEGTHPNAPTTELLTATASYGHPEGWTYLNGYITYQWPTHPDATGKRITEQRVVAYEHLGVELNGHRILHINGDPSDNTWDNLIIQTPEGSIPKPEGVLLWQQFYQWAKTHSPETVERFVAAD